MRKEADQTNCDVAKELMEWHGMVQNLKNAEEKVNVISLERAEKNFRRQGKSLFLVASFLCISSYLTEVTQCDCSFDLISYSFFFFHLMFLNIENDFQVTWHAVVNDGVGKDPTTRL